MKPVRLSTPRLVLDAPTRDDRQLITQYCQDPFMSAYTTIPSPYSSRDADFFIERIVDPGWADDSEYTWALRDADGAPLKGAISWRRARSDIGYWLGAPHRGSGLMPEAVGAVCDWLFRSRITDVVRWEAFQPNAASLHVARRAGFTFTHEGPSDLEARDGTHPLSWHAELHATDSRLVKPGWPAA